MLVEAPPTAMTTSTDLSRGVQEYYGATLSSSADLRTNACCDASSVPEALRPLLARIHPEVVSRYYGCGLVVPPLLEGLPTGACPRRCATIRCSTANASAAPCIGTIFCAWPAGPASPIPAW
jgi:hypothetical protein